MNDSRLETRYGRRETEGRKTRDERLEIVCVAWGWRLVGGSLGVWAKEGTLVPPIKYREFPAYF